MSDVNTNAKCFLAPQEQCLQELFHAYIVNADHETLPCPVGATDLYFNDTTTNEIYPLSLKDALTI